MEDEYAIIDTTHQRFRDATVVDRDQEFLHAEVSADQAPSPLQDELWSEYVEMHDGDVDDEKDDVLEDATVTVQIQWRTIEAMW